MDRKSRTTLRRSWRFLLIAGGVSVASILPLRAAEPVATAQATQLADGTWTVQGPRFRGSRRCGDWLVRLTNARGQLSGEVSHARSNVPIQSLVLIPDGSFSGTAPAGFARSRHAHASKISGQFSGETVSLTFDSEHCPPRKGTATRRATSG
jgi:hypothetical protein